MKRRIFEDIPMKPEMKAKLSDPKGVFADNPAMRRGVKDVERLGTKRYEEVIKNLKEFTGIQDLSTEEGMMALYEIDKKMMARDGIYMKVLQLESKNKEKLEELAVYAGLSYTNIHKNAFQIDAKLERPTLEGFKLAAGPKPEFQEDLSQFSFDVDDLTKKEKFELEVHKKNIVNSIVQGSAILSQHELIKIPYVEEQLNKIDKNLLGYYHIIIAMNDFYYFSKVSLVDLASSQGAAIGGKVQGDEPADDEYQEKGIDTKIVARGIIFPVLCQEVVKGIEDALARLSYAEDDETANQVLNQTDILSNEPKNIWIGPSVVNKIKDALPKEMLSDKNVKNKLMVYFKEALYTIPAQEFLRIIGLVISDNESEVQKGKEEFRMVMKTAEELRYKYENQEDDDELDDLLSKF